jgi:hypothetical protein
VKFQSRDIRALALLGVGVIAMIVYWSMGTAAPAAGEAGESPEVLEARLTRLRQIAASVPARTQVLKSVDADLQSREKGVIAAATAAQAQAYLLEVARRLAIANKIDLRGSDFTAPAVLGADYGQVAVTVGFEASIDSFVNLLSDLSKEPELAAPSEIHISTANQKTKTINVRMTLAGVVARKLVPEKKGGLTL